MLRRLILNMKASISSKLFRDLLLSLNDLGSLNTSQRWALSCVNVLNVCLSKSNRPFQLVCFVSSFQTT